MKVSEFLGKRDLSPFLLGAFYGRYEFSEDGKFIYSVSSYKKSKYVENDKLYLDSKDHYLEILNKFSKEEIWTNEKQNMIKRSEFTCLLENDNNLSKKSFFNKLYTKILSSKFSQEEGLTEDKKMFIRAFFELRGSIDPILDFLSCDYFYNDEFEIKRVRLLIDLFDVPVECLNYNFRELQKDFISGENKRNTQLRVSLSWYCKNIGLFNKYKIEIVEKSCSNYSKIEKIDEIQYFDSSIKNKFQNPTFENRLVFYCNKVKGRVLNGSEIENLRADLGFYNEMETDKTSRNQKIVKLLRLLTPDLCSCCKDKYDIKDRSFIQRKTNKPYLELHHVIAFSNNKNLDIEENLVKLCPVCHKQLKKGIALEEEQKEIIRKILEHNLETFEFLKHVYDEEEKEKIIENVYKNLR